ncbi:hypothetical protein [Flavobacterium sp. UBA4197]|uniref:hypothetical protein n=1 Tax=Flavobacterium sp. UBA4197 TaxID=1946546 RepID=UPI00257FDA45|nr:hypothetical protein [Flavobacterium sp. UBA4197]
MRKLFVITILLVSVLTSCNFSANVKNDNELQDKQDAESVAGLLYLYTSRKEYKSVLNLMSTDFYKVASKDQFLEFLNAKEKKLGEYKDLTLLDWKTTSLKGTDSKTEYLLTYKVVYSNYTAEEKISMIKENNKVKISGYNVNSEGFIK